MTHGLRNYFSTVAPLGSWSEMAARAMVVADLLLLRMRRQYLASQSSGSAGPAEIAKGLVAVVLAVMEVVEVPVEVRLMELQECVLGREG
mmetsp:Transcript_48990/g.114373  ORF Transcript_48990/g.114373 Transcript_48990/m.114373 type:complete len:90 (-) Transcript_48990:371-640(-)